MKCLGWGIAKRPKANYFALSAEVRLALGYGTERNVLVGMLGFVNLE
jgi:hypothetical protein